VKRIMQGGEPFFFPGNPVGCLLIHGFTATPQEIRGLGEFLSEEGYTVLGVRLSGHGTNTDDMNRSRWQDWLTSVEDGYHLLKNECDKVVLVGLSMGGALSLLLASRLSVAGVAALSTPAAFPPNPRLRAIRPLLFPLSLVIRNIPKGPPAWEDPEAGEGRVAYDAYPVRAILELEGLLTEMVRCLPSVRAPVLLMHSKNDQFVSPEHMLKIYATLGDIEKTMVWVERSSHIITCDIDREIVYTTIGTFIRNISRQRP
jgi:carboxylesterase